MITIFTIQAILRMYSRDIQWYAYERSMVVHNNYGTSYIHNMLCINKHDKSATYTSPYKLFNSSYGDG